MKKQEAIEKIEKEKSNLNAWEDLTRNRALDDALAIVRKLDEPEKPVVPRFVADYIDSEQYSCSTLSEALDNMDDEKRILDWFYINSETFAKAWLYGYEVEKEKLYVARFKASGAYLNFDEEFKELHHFRVPEDVSKRCNNYHFTKKKLVEYSVWDNPAFEIKEV